MLIAIRQVLSKMLTSLMYIGAFANYGPSILLINSEMGSEERIDAVWVMQRDLKDKA